MIAALALAALLVAQGPQVCALQPTPTPAPAAIDAGLRTRLEEVDKKAAAITDLRAEFEQRKHSPMLKKPLVSAGTLTARGETVLWHTRTPRPSFMRIGAGEVRVYYPKDAVVEVYDAGGELRELSAAPLPRLATMLARFEVTALDPATLGAPPGPGVLGVLLTPREGALKAHVKSVRVLIDTALGCATKVVMTDADGERTEIAFTNIRLNTGLKDEDVALNVPRGTRESRPVPAQPGAKAAPKGKR